MIEDTLEKRILNELHEAEEQIDLLREENRNMIDHIVLLDKVIKFLSQDGYIFISDDDGFGRKSIQLPGIYEGWNKERFDFLMSYFPENYFRTVVAKKEVSISACEDNQGVHEDEREDKLPL